MLTYSSILNMTSEPIDAEDIDEKKTDFVNVSGNILGDINYKLIILMFFIVLNYYPDIPLIRLA